MITLAIYVFLFSLAASAAMAWISERGEKKYNLTAVYNSNTLLVVSFSFVFTYILLMFSSFIFHGLFYPMQLGIAAAILLYGSLKELRYRGLYKGLLDGKRKETERLTKALAEDPSNSAFLERLSELYSALGRKKEAIEAAQKAVALNPDTTNKWRLDQLKQGSGGERK
ncbi:MAG TPA: hypothetical protein DCL44_05620 [Elusimicrobia bacterium]|nr:hypothetical protein [Elusimicrobiota bacterium]